MFLVTVLVLFLKGGHHYNSMIGISSCGFIGNLLVVGHLGLSFWCSKYMATKIIEKD